MHTGAMDTDGIGQGDELGELREAAGVVDRDGVRRPGLRPFVAGDGRARAIGAMGNAARQAKRAAARGDAVATAELLRTLAGTLSREQVAPVCWAAILSMIGRVERGEQSVRDPDAWVRALADIARMEAGEATSSAVVAHIRGDDVVRRLRALDVSSASSAATAVDDIEARVHPHPDASA